MRHLIQNNCELIWKKMPGLLFLESRTCPEQSGSHVAVVCKKGQRPPNALLSSCRYQAKTSGREVVCVL
jgi:hypothetical protein